MLHGRTSTVMPAKKTFGRRISDPDLEELQVRLPALSRTILRSAKSGAASVVWTFPVTIRVDRRHVARHLGAFGEARHLVFRNVDVNVAAFGLKRAPQALGETSSPNS